MGTTRIKVIDLASDKQEIKTSRKHAEKLSSAASAKKPQKESPKQEEKQAPSEELQAPERAEKTEQTVDEKREDQKSKTNKTKPAKTSSSPAKRGKKYQEARALIEDGKTYGIDEALELLGKTSTTKFDPTIEVHLNVSDKNVRPKINFPHSIGAKKENKYLVFSEKRTEIKGKLITWADEKTVAEIESGKTKPVKDFDIVLASPKFMPKLATVAKILGPKGMMPNPKNGTVTDNIEKFFEENRESAHEFRQDPSSPVLHTKIGKLSFKQEDLKENLSMLIKTVGPTKIRKATITSTMGPGIRLNLSSAGR